MKARRMASGVPYPHRRAVSSTPSAVSSIRRRAVSSRIRSTYRPGGIPTSAVNALANWRGDRLARLASVSTDRSAAG